MSANAAQAPRSSHSCFPVKFADWSRQRIRSVAKKSRGCAYKFQHCHWWVVMRPSYRHSLPRRSLRPRGLCDNGIRPSDTKWVREDFLWSAQLCYSFGWHSRSFTTPSKKSRCHWWVWSVMCWNIDDGWLLLHGGVSQFNYIPSIIGLRCWIPTLPLLRRPICYPLRL